MEKYCGTGELLIHDRDGAATEAMSQHVDDCTPCQRALQGERKGFQGKPQDSDELSPDKKVQAVRLRGNILRE